MLVFSADQTRMLNLSTDLGFEVAASPTDTSQVRVTKVPQRMLRIELLFFKYGCVLFAVFFSSFNWFVSFRRSFPLDLDGFILDEFCWLIDVLII